MQLRLSAILVLLLGTLGYGQTTTVSGTVTDADGQTWNNGTYSISFIPTPGAGPQFNYNGSVMTAAQKGPYTGSLSGGGAFSVAIPDNTFITPSGTQWRFTICPLASAPCIALNATVSGATLNLTPTIGTPAGLRFPAGPGAFGYLDVEVTPIPNPGGSYWNSANACVRVWNGSAFNCSTGGSPGAPDGAVQFRSAGVFTGSSDFTWSNVTGLSIGAGGNQKTIMGSGQSAQSGVIVPRLLSIQDGTFASPLTTQSATNPSFGVSTYDGTAPTVSGYASYGSRFARETATGIDVQSGLTIGCFGAVKSTNTIATPSKTAQVCYLGNMTATVGSDAGMEVANWIISDPYNGANTKGDTGNEVDMLITRAPGMFNQANATYGVANSAVIAGGGNGASIAYSADSSQAATGFLWGGLCAACVNAGWAVTHNTVSPTVNFYAGGGGTYGLYVGSHSLGFTLNPGQTLLDPTIGVDLGERGTTSSLSNILRFTSTDGGSAEHFMDFQEFADKSLHLQSDGVDKYIFGSNGDFGPVGNVTSVRLISTQTTGTAPITVASTTPVANLNASPTMYNAAGTQIVSGHMVVDSCTLGTNCGVSLSGAAAFSNSTSYKCTCADASGISACKVNQTAGNAVTFTGAGVDVINYQCSGN